LGESRLTGARSAYPTDAKEKDKAKKKADKEAGIERQAQRRKKVMEDHYYDCGDDLSSFMMPEASVGHATSAMIPTTTYLKKTMTFASTPNSDIVFSAIQWTMTR
jgi:hypothetical protein